MESNLNLSTDTFPRKILNGSSFDQLFKDVDAVVINLQKLEHTLLQVYPHPRDYPLNEDYQKANAQHEQHLKAVQDLHEFYMKKQMHIHDENQTQKR